MPSGIHHITIIASSARRNLDFYTGTLGLRLVKKTVNFDDPSTYHLYYGDAAGHPGTILTFFPWDRAAPGRSGIGEAQETVFSVPEGSIGYWTHRFVEKGVGHDPPTKRFGQTRLAFKDLDGTRLALCGVKGIEEKPAWNGGGVPSEHSIRGFHSVSLLLAEATPTCRHPYRRFRFCRQRPRGRHSTISGAGRRRRRHRRAQDRGRIFVGAPRLGLGSPHRVSGGRRRRAGGDGRQARPTSWPAHHRADGSQIFSLNLFPRARPSPVRNRHRSARVCGRRAA